MLGTPSEHQKISLFRVFQMPVSVLCPALQVRTLLSPLNFILIISGSLANLTISKTKAGDLLKDGMQTTYMSQSFKLVLVCSSE